MSYAASSEAFKHAGELSISGPLLYRTDAVVLVLTPMAGMNWWTWSTALWGIRITVQDHGMYFEWSFDVFTRVSGRVGYGSLIQLRSDSVDKSKG